MGTTHQEQDQQFADFIHKATEMSKIKDMPIEIHGVNRRRANRVKLALAPSGVEALARLLMGYNADPETVGLAILFEAKATVGTDSNEIENVAAVIHVTPFVLRESQLTLCNLNYGVRQDAPATELVS